MSKNNDDIGVDVVMIIVMMILQSNDYKVFIIFTIAPRSSFSSFLGSSHAKNALFFVSIVTRM